MKFGKSNSSILLGLAILFRLIFLFSIPNLSQDFYRFIWDGRLLFEGLNPYLSIPENFIEQRNFPIADAQKLYEGMGNLNGSHFTNYPPLHQLCFVIAAFFASKSIFGAVIILRLIIISADIGILYFGKKLLKNINIPVYHIFWYVLNPFIIIELTGNLHFESVMLFFLIWSFYQLQQKRWVFAGILLGCSISVKLIPLLFLPLFYQWFFKKNVIASATKQSYFNKEIASSQTPYNHNEKKWISVSTRITKLLLFYIIILTTVILFFLPFYSTELIKNYINSVGLWFVKFEFNASFYYLFREIGFWSTGYNKIALIGKITPMLTVLFIAIFTFFRKNNNLKQLITACLFGLSFYYFTTTTMHPWYVSTLILLSVFTKYRFPIVWSLVIMLSYSAYQNETYQENLWLVSLEYLIVYGFLIWELFTKQKHPISLTKKINGFI